MGIMENKYCITGRYTRHLPTTHSVDLYSAPDLLEHTVLAKVPPRGATILNRLHPGCLDWNVILLHKHGGGQSFAGVPRNMTMQHPQSRVRGAERKDGVAASGEHECVPADGIGECETGWILIPSSVALGENVHNVAMHVDSVRRY